MTDGLFKSVPGTTVLDIDPTKDYSADLIGEGKKYATVKDAARALLEKDVHINRVQTDAQALRDDLNKRMTTEELLQKLKESNQSPNLPNAGNLAAGDQGDAPLLKPEQIDALIKRSVSEAVTSLSTEAEAKRNVDTVREALTGLWGNEYPAVLQAKAKELGVSEDWITQAARTTPKVLLTLVTQGETGKQKVQDNLFVPSPTGINSAGLNRASSSNLPPEAKYSYWKAMRDTNPKQYHSVPETQKRHKAAGTYGEAFYNN